jgi:hypothetical protein
METGYIGRYNLRQRGDGSKTTETSKALQQVRLSRKKVVTQDKNSLRKTPRKQRREETAVAEVLGKPNLRKRNWNDLDGELDIDRELKHKTSPDPLPPTPKSEKRSTRGSARVNAQRNRDTIPIPEEETVIDSTDSTLTAPRPDLLNINTAEISNVQRPFRSAPASISSFDEDQRRQAAEQRLQAQYVLNSPIIFKERETHASSEVPEVQETLPLARILKYEKPQDTIVSPSFEQSLRVLAETALNGSSNGVEDPVEQADSEGNEGQVQTELQMSPEVLDNLVILPEPEEPVREEEVPFDVHEIVTNFFLGSYALKLQN